MTRTIFRLLASVALLVGVAGSAHADDYTDSPTGCGSYTPICGLPGAVSLPLSDDDTELVNLSFTFNWYGDTPITSLRVSSNGQINIDGSTNSNCCDDDLVEVSGAWNTPRIAIIQEDLNPPAGGEVCVLDSGTSLIVSYEGIAWFGSAGPGNAQAELFMDGTIDIRFGSMTPGDDITVGVEDDTRVPPSATPASGTPFGAGGRVLEGDFGALSGQCRRFSALPPTSEVGLCDDGVDNDNDGQTDCDDTDCATDPSCIAEICDNGVDDDNDGKVDCADNECFGHPSCPDALCGPVILAGHDADDHGFESVYKDLFNAMLASVSNGQSGILVVGAADGSTPDNWVTNISNLMTFPQSVSVADGVAAINAVDFNDYAIIVVPSDVDDTPGGITQTEYDAFNARALDVQFFINNGGGLFSNTPGEFTNPFGFIDQVGGVTVVSAPSSGILPSGSPFDDITATPDGNLLGITDTNVDGCCFHNVFTSFPAFLDVLGVANEPAPADSDYHNEAVFLGGLNACVLPFCGDDVLDPGEQCDDGNNDDGDGCSADCQFELASCGDGTLDPGEACDDGNNQNGDGCDEFCCVELCGNGAVDPGEQCDDGNTFDGDGCDAVCDIEPFCGDGCLDPGEECDDGNTVDGDGCASDCLIENAPPVIVCTPPERCNDAGLCNAAILCSEIAVAFDPEDGQLVVGCAPGGPYAVPGTTVTATAMDSEGVEVEVDCVVTVQDCEAPDALCPTPVAAECSSKGGVAASLIPLAATATDNCDPVDAVGCLPPMYAAGCGPAGATTPVAFTTADSADNKNFCKTSVTVTDVTAPVVTAPGDRTIECTAPGGTPSSQCDVQAWLAQATAVDVCFDATVANDAPALLPASCAGTLTTVTFAGVDSCGNASANMANITVEDTTAPEIVDCAMPAVPAPATPARSSTSDYVFRVDCGIATDVCDSSPLSVTPTLEITNTYEGCVPAIEEIPVLCGQLLELRQLAPPDCPRSPRSARPATSVDSDGILVVNAEAFTLVVTAADACGLESSCAASPCNLVEFVDELAEAPTSKERAPESAARSTGRGERLRSLFHSGRRVARE